MKSLNYEEVKAQIANLDTPKLEISVLLYRPKSEMNIGHIFRLADAAGIQKIWLYQPIEHIKWHKIEKLSRKNSRHIAYEIIQSYDELPEIPKLALEWTDKSVNLYEFAPPSKELLLIVGNEQKGLPEDLLSQCEEAIHLPMYGKHSSMNMAMASAIAVYHIIHNP